jgi:hypothetical protein
MNQKAPGNERIGCSNPLRMLRDEVSGGALCLLVLLRVASSLAIGYSGRPDWVRRLSVVSMAEDRFSRQLRASKFMRVNSVGEADFMRGTTRVVTDKSEVAINRGDLGAWGMVVSVTVIVGPLAAERMGILSRPTTTCSFLGTEAGWVKTGVSRVPSKTRAAL